VVQACEPALRRLRQEDCESHTRLHSENLREKGQGEIGREGERQRKRLYS
jgi:hypothetical protein